MMHSDGGRIDKSWRALFWTEFVPSAIKWDKLQVVRQEFQCDEAAEGVSSALQTAPIPTSSFAKMLK